MWKTENGAGGTEPIEVAVYVPRESIARTAVDALDRFGCRLRFLISSADVHRCFVDGTASLAVVYIGDGTSVGRELLQGYRKVRGVGHEPYLVAIGDHCAATRRDALSAGAGDYLQTPFTSEQAAERFAVAVRMARWLDSFRRDRFRLQREVNLNASRLNDARLEIARLLGRAAEFRDNETGRHVVRVSRSCEVVARELGLPDDDVMLITQASPLHDIGKIGVPDSILLKPGPLTAGEWRQMKRHTVIGGRILAEKDDPLIATARTIALTHHERWDGGGYPRRLKAESIPLVGRIVAVCDAFDALTSTRPYKEPWAMEAAFAYIEAGAGSQFDPTIAAAFGRVSDQIAGIRAEHAEEGEFGTGQRNDSVGCAPSFL